METLVKVVLGSVMFFGLIFFSAWGYSTAWNMIVPAIFGVGTITMLQAYVGASIIAITTQHVGKPDNTPSFFFLMGAGYTRVAVVLLFALIVKTFFI